MANTSPASFIGPDGDPVSVTAENPLPVLLESGNVVINGPVTVANEVEIKNNSGNPIPTSSPHELGSDGVFIPVDSLTATFAYNTDNTLNYLQCVYLGSTYRQTYSWSNGKVSSITGWVKQ